MIENPILFAETAAIATHGPATADVATRSHLKRGKLTTSPAKVTKDPQTGVKIDELPMGVAASNTLVDFTATASPELRSAVCLAMVFAGRVASMEVGKKADEDEWLAAYQTSLGKLGFAVTGGAVQRSRFKKKGLLVHKAIIPFLTIALGGAGVGPVILAALKHLKEVEKDRPWITLFDRESRRYTSSELHFAAVTSDATNTTIRHVVARLVYQATQTSVLFWKIDDVNAEFESATSHMVANNQMLASLAPKLLARMEADVDSYLAGIGDALPQAT